NRWFRRSLTARYPCRSTSTPSSQDLEPVAPAVREIRLLAEEPVPADAVVPQRQDIHPVERSTPAVPGEQRLHTNLHHLPPVPGQVARERRVLHPLQPEVLEQLRRMAPEAVVADVVDDEQSHFPGVSAPPVHVGPV